MRPEVSDFEDIQPPLKRRRVDSPAKTS